MTKYNSFIVHKNILYTDMGIEDIERTVETGLYDETSELVTFHILKLTGNMVKMVFYRDFPLEEHNADSIFDVDMNLIAGFGMNCFRSKEAGGYPLLALCYNDYNGHWFTDTEKFIDFYKCCLYARECQKIRQMGIRCYKDRIMMHITFEDEQETE